MKPDKGALAELYNCLLKCEEDFPPNIRIERFGPERELWLLYKDLPNIILVAGEGDTRVTYTMVIPDEMLKLKEGRGAAIKSFVRIFVQTVKEAVDEYDQSHPTGDSRPEPAAAHKSN